METREAREIPSLNHAYYISKLGYLDDYAEGRVRNSFETLTEEFHGKFEDWDEKSHSFVDDIVSVRPGIKMYTRASLNEESKAKGKFLNSPDDIDHYELWVSCMREVQKICINTTDRELAKEIHHYFFRILLQCETGRVAYDRVLIDSPYSARKCPTDSSIPLLDTMSKASRLKIRERDEGRRL